MSRRKASAHHSSRQDLFPADLDLGPDSDDNEEINADDKENNRDHASASDEVSWQKL